MAARIGRPRRSSGEAGFSLIELMVTVLVLGILLGIAALAYAGITRESALSSAGKQVEGAMKRAQTAASQENVTYTVTFYPSTDAHPNTYAFWRLGATEPEQNKYVPGEVSDGGYIRMENGVTVVSLASVTFTPAGTTMSITPATVSLSMGGESRNVSISSNGTIAL